MLQDEFDVRMHEVYRAGKREARFSAPLFAEMLKEHGGLETARRFLHSADYAAGFTALWERERLDWPLLRRSRGQGSGSLYWSASRMWAGGRTRMNIPRSMRWSTRSMCSWAAART